jgi:hypothetical protein
MSSGLYVVRPTPATPMRPHIVAERIAEKLPPRPAVRRVPVRSRRWRTRVAVSVATCIPVVLCAGPPNASCTRLAWPAAAPAMPGLRLASATGPDEEDFTASARNAGQENQVWHALVSAYVSWIWCLRTSRRRVGRRDGTRERSQMHTQMHAQLPRGFDAGLRGFSADSNISGLIGHVIANISFSCMDCCAPNDACLRMGCDPTQAAHVMADPAPASRDGP